MLPPNLEYSNYLNTKQVWYLNADDAYALRGADNESVKGIFRQYERLTKKSGLELNAEKTEILSMHTNVPRTYNVTYCGVNISLTTLTEIKICGIWYRQRLPTDLETFSN